VGIKNVALGGGGGAVGGGGGGGVECIGFFHLFKMKYAILEVYNYKTKNNIRGNSKYMYS
jgi:hypothetical protein